MDEKLIAELSERIVKAGKELYARGLVKGTSGNISVRIPSINTFLIKPSGACMGNLKPEDLVLVDLQGNKIRGELNVSMETPIHAAIYRARKDVQAVVHTHPPTATAFGIAKNEILPLQIELFMLLPNGVPIIPFKAPGSRALAEAVQKKIADYDAVILENHGIITVGTTVEAACNLNEMVEEAAKVQLSVMMLTGGRVMNLAELKKKFKMQNAIE
ncbi:MAG: class II aldolase/adducin family protein [Candidatus Bathyarchaeales archaeon]